MWRGLAPGGTNRVYVVDDANGHVAPLQGGKRDPGLGRPPWDVARAAGCLET